MNFWTNQWITCFRCCFKLLLQPQWNLIRISNERKYIFKAANFHSAMEVIALIWQILYDIRRSFEPKQKLCWNQNTHIRFCMERHFMWQIEIVYRKIQLYCNFQNKHSKPLIVQKWSFSLHKTHPFCRRHSNEVVRHCCKCGFSFFLKVVFFGNQGILWKFWVTQKSRCS